MGFRRPGWAQPQLDDEEAKRLLPQWEAALAIVDSRVKQVGNNPGLVFASTEEEPLPAGFGELTANDHKIWATVIAVFALWGLSQLLLGLLYLLAALRYRSLVPLFYLLMILEYGGRMIVAGAKPIETAGTAPGAVGNLPLMLLAAVMLVLSLIPGKPKDGA